MDILEICLEEIALEGLEGITIPTLWLRLENRKPPLTYQLSNELKEYLWRFIVQQDSFGIYAISNDRLEPQLFDRFEGREENCIAIAKAPDELDSLVDVYSRKALMDVVNIRGACSDYQSRADIKKEILDLTCELTLELYGARKLIIVASQNLRESVFLLPNMSSTVISELSDFMYCVLERVARARWQGELQAVLNRLNFCDNKALNVHYVVNKLQKLGLVVKKNHTYRRPDKNNRTYFQVLIIFKKFEQDRLTFSERAALNAIEILNSCPSRSMNMGKLRDMLQMDERQFKTLYLRLQKSGSAVTHDINPNKKAKTLSFKIITLTNKPGQESTVEDGDDDDDQDIQMMFAQSSLPASRLLALERPLIYQSFAFVVDNGAKGVVQRQVLEFLKGYGRLEARNICKIFARMNLVNVVLVDHGKHRMQCFIPKNLSMLSESSIEFSDEKKKMQQLLRKTTSFTTKSMKDLCLEISRGNSQNALAPYNSFAKSQESESVATVEQTSMVVIGDRSFECFRDEKIDPESRADRLNFLMQDGYTSGNAHMRKWDAHLTTRKIKRHNIVLEQLNQVKIIQGYRSIQRCLYAAEEKEGVTTKIDKKTVIRLIDKMHYEGVLQHSVIPIVHKGRTVDFHFIMALDCPPNLLKSSVDQARFKLLGDEEHRVARLEQEKLRDEIREEKKIKKEMESSLDKTLKATPTWPKREKLAQKFFQPKFKRLRIMHQLLWYLLYGHLESQNWTPDMGIADPDELKVHDEENCWRRFLPPAPIHFHDGLKWLQLGDIAIILPLSIFCQFHRVIHKHDELEPWLADDEKRHVLVRHLPQDIRSSLFYKRRYLFSLMTCIEQLAFMGLISMRRGRRGINFNMPKENMMIYVNKNVSILDTRSSAKRHLMVEDKPYEKLTFKLDHLDNVDEYWYKLQDICAQTRLGSSSAHSQSEDSEMAKRIKSEVKRFAAMINSTQPKPEDDGEIPGDRRGAGGLDSSMYSYLYRNWRSKPHSKRTDFSLCDFDGANSPYRLPTLRERNLTLMPAAKKRSRSPNGAESSVGPTRGRKTTERKTVSARNRSGSIDAKSDTETKKKGAKKRKRSDDSTTEKKAKTTKSTAKKNQNEATESAVREVDTDKLKVVLVSNTGRNKRVKGGRGVKRKKCEEPIVMELPKKKHSREIIRRRRKPQEIQQGKQRLKYVDKRDLEAIKSRKGRIRVNFSQAEDDLFLQCHIGSSLITQLFWNKQYQPRKQLIPWPVVRDLVHSQLPGSLDKTSYSVGRRTLYLMKDPEARIYHDISVADLKADAEFLRKALPGEVDFSRGSQDLPKVYKKLMKHLREKFRTQPGLFNDELPETTVELARLFSPKSVLHKIDELQKKRRLFRDDIACHDDIAKAVAENMTHIALSMGDAEFSVYQAYRAFEAFPNEILSDIFVQMQVSGIVCTKTTMVRRLPFGIRSHRLAHAHSQSLKAPIPKETLNELCDAIDSTSNISVDVDIPAGHIFLMSYFLTKGVLDVSIDVPEQIILPDAPNTQLFENQFSAMLENTKEDILKEIQEAGLGSVGEENLVPSSSMMAAAACVLRESLEDDGKTKKGAVPVAAAIPETEETRLKITEILKLYTRHPSYTNWLMLINPQRNELSEGKFRNPNYAVNSDAVVLSPCKVVLENTLELIRKYIKNINTFEDSLRPRPELISAYLNSAKLDGESSRNAWDQHINRPKAVAHFYLAKAVFEEVDKAGEMGLTKADICQSLNFDERTVSSVLADLVEKLVVFSVGVSVRLYVSYHHAQRWTAKGYDFCGGVSNFQNEISHEIKLLQHAKSQEKEKATCASEVEVTSSENAVVKDTMDLAPQATQSVKNLYKEVRFVCRPWHTICGDVSFKVARSLLMSVYLKVLAAPGITKDKLCASFTFQPVCIIELLDILCQAGCVTEHVLEAPKTKRLFGASTPKKRTVYYEATQDGVITVGQWCQIIEKMVGRMTTMSPSRP